MTDEDLERRHVFISGRVQGVTFRATTRRKAKQYGVKGWVKNLPDGRVEAVFEGPENQVEKLVEFCHEGPRMARVDEVQSTTEQPTGAFDGFQIQY